MLNIIIYRHSVLVELFNEKFELPKTKSLQYLSDKVKPIHMADNLYVASIDSEKLINLTPKNLQFINLRQAMNHLSYDLVKQIVYFQQLNDYYLTHKFCGSCGTTTVRRNMNKFVFCPYCNQENYPHIAPCIIVRIHHNDTILMSRGVNFPPGAWGLIAGFVEVGETLEECVKREVHEEVGIEIDNIKYWGSQPWPFPSNSLMIGYTAQYKSGDLILDKTEIEEAGFYTASTLPGAPSTSFSIASQMINEFVNNSIQNEMVLNKINPN